MKTARITTRLLKPALIGLSITLAAPTIGFADPPPWAPAWGYRDKQKNKSKHKKKNKVRYEKYDETEYVHTTRDVGIYHGTCDRETVGAILGGAVGGAAGAQVGKGDGQIAAAVAGTILGVIVGRSIGRSMDQLDHHCTGQVLERAETDQTVTWQNPETGARYSVTPTNTYESGDRFCRDYVSKAVIDGRAETVTGTACRQPDGSWEKAG